MDPKDYEQLLKEATFHFSRSGGKGGQNVNKVETKVTLTFNIQNSHALNEYEKCRVSCILKNKIDHEGNLHITASSERYQHANRRIVEEKFVQLIKDALKPKKRRLRTAPSATSKLVRLVTKQKHSMKKQTRKKKFFADE